MAISSESEMSAAPKRRKAAKACDVCRLKKIRCDGIEASGHRCSYCVTHGEACTFGVVRKRSSQANQYAEDLEKRLGALENFLLELRPDIDLSHELSKLDLASETTNHPRRSSSNADDNIISMPPPTGSGLLPLSPPPGDYDSLDSSDDEELDRRTKTLWVDHDKTRVGHLGPGGVPIFFGKSSSARFVSSLIGAQAADNPDRPKPTFAELRERMITHSRKEFWMIHPYEQKNWARPSNESPLVFPEESLVVHLIDVYFRWLNPFGPFLHRQSLQNDIDTGLHFKNRGFGAVLLLICANAARFSDDPRVATDDHLESPAAWDWFNSIHVTKQFHPGGACLYDVQVYTLAAMFLKNSTYPPWCWTIIGLGLRAAIDVGAHRRKVYQTTPTLNDELWKRAFWALVLMDRQVSCALGRALTIHDEDMDLDYPAEIDDQDWVIESGGGRLSKIETFTLQIKLYQLLAFASRTLYSINKARMRFRFVGPEWEQRTVMQLDSAMNAWKNSLPPHLKWEPSHLDVNFFNQAASLHMESCYVQIMIHRPFLDTTPNRSPDPMSTLICINAARSAVHTADVQRNQTAHFPIGHGMASLYISGVVLYMATKEKHSVEQAKKDLALCLEILNTWRRRWPTAGRLRDIIIQFLSFESNVDFMSHANHPPYAAADHLLNRHEDLGITQIPPEAAGNAPVLDLDSLWVPFAQYTSGWMPNTAAGPTRPTSLSTMLHTEMYELGSGAEPQPDLLAVANANTLWPAALDPLTWTDDMFNAQMEQTYNQGL